MQISPKVECFICECSSLDHIISIWHDEDENKFYIQTKLVTYKDFWQRLKRAVVFNVGKRKGKINLNRQLHILLVSKRFL